MFDYLANPTRFRAITAVIFPLALAITMLAMVLGIYLAFFRLAPRLPTRRQRAHYVYPRPRRVDGDAGIYSHGDLGGVLFGVATSFGGYWREGDGGARGGVCFDYAHHRGILGQADLGGLVGVGCAPDLDVDSAVSVSWLYGTGRIGFARSERGSKAASLLLLVGVINLPIIKFRWIGEYLAPRQ